MTPPVKLGLATVGAAGVTTTAYYGGGLLLNRSETVSKDMPSWRPLVKDTEFLSDAKKPKDEFKDKYAADHARLLVGTGADLTSAGIKPQSNSEWWNWVFKTKYEPSKEQFKGGFKDLTRGAKGEKTDNKSIQEACDKAYKVDKSKVKSGNPSTVATDEFNEDHVWTLCSALGSKPALKTIEEAKDSTAKTKLADQGEWKGKLGETKKADLLDIDSSGNTEAWKELNKQYQSEKPNAGFFKWSEPTKDINIKCGAAYAVNDAGSDASDTSKPTEDDLYKWCSLKGYKPS